MNLIVTATSQGLLWGVMALGIFITFRILDLPDMTAEGSFPLGAAVCSKLILSGVHPIIATLVAFISGMLAGAITGFLITKCNIPGLLAGILTMTGLYSINLRIMGRANLSLLGKEKLNDLLRPLHLPAQFDTILIGLIIVVAVILLLILFFNTELGQALIATGDNEIMARSLGVSTNKTKILALMLSNGMIAFAGGLITQDNGYADISMGIGTIVIGLASVIIGEVVFGNLSLGNRLICVILGAIIYRLIITFVLVIGLQPNDLKLFSAIILAICLALPSLRSKLNLNFFAKKEEA
ncbi:branched-chain amino acid ABC transporter permease [Carnobacterium divergens]|uniref:ABC transporter permease n=1 Tax=Carnobacterium divergens TaxID=2748 RepID=UPI0010719EA2|nr:ABC transporter permease [Carnobacterium divergens]TFJ38574.1 branched-chain amino acid ABC transporter permease [Carnobacterium divergens]TFJ47808.1 branched-chain amino acid ABC transporter permease [Carnobacterium divergens]TFJ52772.1 branched-chain amino acid ABC transporter permease [Carnobacterium divergens]TFJ58497.1 branched-chain amino acid ABC transporter permease [Carnobacterium divergens]TFJ68562.1 branched-chain amino acid ABC transporter permease [Carnobacterium divergens]